MAWLLELQQVFSNREIAYGFWIMVTVVILSFTKAGQQFFKSLVPIFFCKKFVLFYGTFIGVMLVIIKFLSHVGFWDISLLKDTIFWIMFVEMPIFVKAIEKAKDQRFFRDLIKDNIKITVAISFVMNFWSLSLLWEVLLVPIIIFFSAMYVFSDRDKASIMVKQLLDKLFFAAGAYVVYLVLENIILHSTELFNLQTMKEFILPFILLILNLPVVYGLAVYNQYEQIFIRLKGDQQEQKKMKIRILKFSNIELATISLLRDNDWVLYRSLTDLDMKENLEQFELFKDSRLGDNYMKRANFYYIWCIIGISIFISALIACNSDVGIKDIFSLNFVVDISALKAIITQICVIGLVFGIAALIFSIGFKKKKYEEITIIKKFALHDFIQCLLRQKLLMDQNKISNDRPLELFVDSIQPAYELKIECDKIISSYDNLLKRWELDDVSKLQLRIDIFLDSVSTDVKKLTEMSVEDFQDYYAKRVEGAPKSEKMNVYLYDIEKELESYKERINICVEEFKNIS